jgi:REP element-mobilizing transposase RayT
MGGNLNMARLSRVEIFAPDEIAIVHVMNRTVRRCFLMGHDPLTGKNYDHRKSWCEEELVRMAAQFGIDLLGYAILSNHFHLILRSRPDVVSKWSDTEVARRWWKLCPPRKGNNGKVEEPSETELNSIRNNPLKLAETRSRLSDISWWMRLLSQKIAQRANREDCELGKFWQARYRAVRLLDEAALLACTAYVDLNPIRAGIAKTIEESNFTSAQKRLAAIIQSTHPSTQIDRKITEAAEDRSMSGMKKAQPQPNHDDPGLSSKPPRTDCPSFFQNLSRDRHLSPLAIDERHDPIGACLSLSGQRASDKGFLPMSEAAYLELLDWTARELKPGKRGQTPANLEPLLERIEVDAETWCSLVKDFGRLFYAMAGKPHVIEGHTSRDGQRRYKTKGVARKLLAA